jgi:maleate isomerase
MAADGYGYRARIGLVYIASSVVMEPECYAMAPAGVSVHTARIPVEKATVEALSKLAGENVANLLEATRLLATAPLHSIVFACTSGSFIGGKGYDERIMGQMREVASGLPVTTTATALLKSLQALDARRVVLATPYTSEVTERAITFLTDNGVDVLAFDYLGLEDDLAIGFTPPERTYKLVRGIDRPDADAVVISCTNLRTVAILEALEQDLGKPVISAIQASFWDGLRLAGVRERIPHYGRLLQL